MESPRISSRIIYVNAWHTRGLPTARLVCFIEPQRLVHGFMAVDKAEFIDTVLFLNRPVLHPRNRLVVHASILTNVRWDPIVSKRSRLYYFFVNDIIINVKILLSIKRLHCITEVVSSPMRK